MANDIYASIPKGKRKDGQPDALPLVMTAGVYAVHIHQYAGIETREMTLRHDQIDDFIDILQRLKPKLVTR